ncbi:hypothetical protein [Pontiella sp.]|uniref:hypothetical protein n=1 Tax=Pontiella sp. TaxID=2837462 RepID=UPI00356700EF
MTINGERTVYLHSGGAGSDEYGNVVSNTFKFLRGETYTVSIAHVGSSRNSPDYDYTLKIQVAGEEAAVATAQTLEEDWVPGSTNEMPVEVETLSSAGTSVLTNGVVLEDTNGILGKHTESSYFYAKDVSFDMLVGRVELELSQATMTLKHDNLCELEIETTPESIDFTDHEIEIRFQDETRWYSLATNEICEWTTRIAGDFYLRAKANKTYVVWSTEKKEFHVPPEKEIGGGVIAGLRKNQIIPKKTSKMLQTEKAQREKESKPEEK